MRSQVLILAKLVLLAITVAVCGATEAGSLRFMGNASPEVDRVSIPLGDPAGAQPGPPANIGATDFTIEFWLRASSGNTQSAVTCDAAVYSWIEGNIVLDRDRLPPNARDFGLSVAGGRIAFGIEPERGNPYTICSDSAVLDGGWHHVAVQRRLLDGQLWLYVNGRLERQARGPAGEVSYPVGAPASDPREALLVLGAEKYDYDLVAYPGFRGWIDELRLSTVLRYPVDDGFSVATAPFECDASTAALYHFDEGAGDIVIDACGNASPGTRDFGGQPAGPRWATETPFDAALTGRLRFNPGAVSVDEAVGEVELTVERTGGASGLASVDVVLSGGSATAGADFSLLPTTLAWASGVAGSKPIIVTIVDDADAEPDETVMVGLSNAVGAQFGEPTLAMLTIVDNDTELEPEPEPEPGPGPEPGGEPPRPGSGEEPEPAPPASGTSGGGGGALGGLSLLLGVTAVLLHWNRLKANAQEERRRRPQNSGRCGRLRKNLS